MEVRSGLTGRRGVSLPFTDFCGPLIFDVAGRSNVLIEFLLSRAREREWKYAEVRGWDAPVTGVEPSVGFRGHTVDLRGGADEIFDRCSGSVRRAVRKAERSGLTIERLRTREAMLDFYELHVRTRRRHGIPPQPRSFFLNIHNYLIEAGNGFVLIARQGSRAIASAVFLHFGRRAVYKFGASDERFQQSRANNLVMWEGIKLLAELGFDTLHLGRTSIANKGLERFKLGWGANEEPIRYFKFDPVTRDLITGRDNSSGLHTQVFRKLPAALNRLAGAIIYPHLD